jgi:hypothetical protein
MCEASCDLLAGADALALRAVALSVCVDGAVATKHAEELEAVLAEDHALSFCVRGEKG